MLDSGFRRLQRVLAGLDQGTEPACGAHLPHLLDDPTIRGVNSSWSSPRSSTLRPLAASSLPPKPNPPLRDSIPLPGTTPRPPTRQQHQRQRQQKQQPHHPKHITEGQQRGLAAHLVTEQLQGLIGYPAGPLPLRAPGPATGSAVLAATDW